MNEPVVRSAARTRAVRRAGLRSTDIIGINEAAEALGISKETARTRIRDSGLQPLQVLRNGMKLYDPTELRKAIVRPQNRSNAGFATGLRLCIAPDCCATYRGQDARCPKCRDKRHRMRRAATLAEADKMHNGVSHG